MKVKTTRRSIVESTLPKNLISVGYCELQTLLRNHSPIAYTSGMYGWNFDVYDVYGKTICTGYRGMPGHRPNNPTDYETKARKIMDQYERNYEDRSAEVESLLREFCEQA